MKKYQEPRLTLSSINDFPRYDLTDNSFEAKAWTWFLSVWRLQEVAFMFCDGDENLCRQKINEGIIPSPTILAGQAIFYKSDFTVDFPHPFLRCKMERYDAFLSKETTRKRKELHDNKQGGLYS